VQEVWREEQRITQKSRDMKDGRKEEKKKGRNKKIKKK
jgi:hypothetical protein